MRSARSRANRCRPAPAQSRLTSRWRWFPWSFSFVRPRRGGHAMCSASWWTKPRRGTSTVPDRVPRRFRRQALAGDPRPTLRCVPQLTGLTMRARSARLASRRSLSLAPGLPRNDVGHEKVTRGGVVDSRAYRRPTRITRRHLFRVGQRAARSVPERRSAKFRRASRFLLVQGRQRAQGVEGRRQSLLGWALHHLMISTTSTFWFSGPIMKCTRQSRRIRSHAKRKASSFRGARSSPSLAVADQDFVAGCADLRTIGLQASQHPHGVLICGLAKLTDCGRAGGAFLRRSLLLTLVPATLPRRGPQLKGIFATSQASWTSAASFLRA